MVAGLVHLIARVGLMVDGLVHLMGVGLVLEKEIRLVLMKDGLMELLMVAQMDLVFPMVTQKVEGLALPRVILMAAGLVLAKEIRLVLKKE